MDETAEDIDSAEEKPGFVRDETVEERFSPVDSEENEDAVSAVEDVDADDALLLLLLLLGGGFVSSCAAITV